MVGDCVGGLFDKFICFLAEASFVYVQYSSPLFQELLQYLLEHDQCQERELLNFVVFGEMPSLTTADAIFNPAVPVSRATPISDLFNLVPRCHSVYPHPAGEAFKQVNISNTAAE